MVVYPAPLHLMILFNELISIYTENMILNCLPLAFADEEAAAVVSAEAAGVAAAAAEVAAAAPTADCRLSCTIK